MEFANILSPIKIGPMELKNRFVVAPMSNNFAVASGNLSERSMYYYRERAKGGFGLITVEATVVDKTAKGGPKKSCLFEDSQIEGLKKVVEACHPYGAKVSIQLQQAGPEGSAKAAGYPLKSASPVQASCNKDVPIEMKTEQIYELVEIYGNAAERAMKAGVDAVEIHMAHGYLVSSFLSPQTNKRLDEFGGSFENRMRLPKLIVEKVIEKTGHKIAILVRLNSADELLGGLTVQDTKLIAKCLESYGVDAIDLSRSVHIHDEYMWAPSPIHAGYNLEHVSEIKKSVSIPVSMVGRFNDPYLADLLIGEGRCDLITMGRQSIADPWIPNKTKEKRLDELVPCIACLQGCVGNMFKGEPITCLANPFVGYEKDLDFKVGDQAKKVMVVGAGVAGLYAAWILAARGHDVTIYEKTGEIGGQMRLAAFPPGKGDITTLVRTYYVLCQKHGVKFEMNTEVNEKLIEEVNPDTVLLATGATPLVPPISGVEATVNAIDVLAGNVTCGKKVLVLGGGMVGAETADYLAERCYDVTILEMKEKVAMDISGEHRIFMMKNFEKNEVKMVTEATVTEIFNDGVSYKHGDDVKELRNFDTVVLALGAKSYNPLEEKIAGRQVYSLGDCVKAGKALDAIAQAKSIALTI